MCSETKKKIRLKSGKMDVRWSVIGRRQNHLWDCECMQTAAAFMQGILVNPFGVEKTEEETSDNDPKNVEPTDA